jgi:hypothetical protein
VGHSCRHTRALSARRPPHCPSGPLRGGAATGKAIPYPPPQRPSCGGWHSSTRALGHSGARALGRSGTRALGHSGTRALGHSGARALGHSGTRALGHSGTRALGHSGTRALSGRRPPHCPSGPLRGGAATGKAIPYPPPQRPSCGGWHSGTRALEHSGTRALGRSGTRALGHSSTRALSGRRPPHCPGGPLRGSAATGKAIPFPPPQRPSCGGWHSGARALISSFREFGNCAKLRPKSA